MLSKISQKLQCKIKKIIFALFTFSVISMLNLIVSIFGKRSIDKVIINDNCAKSKIFENTQCRNRSET